MNSNEEPTPGLSPAPGRVYITVKEVSVMLGFGSKYIIAVITLLLRSEIMISPEDVIAAGTANRRKFRVHKDTGLAKIKAHLKAQKVVN